MKSHLCHPGTCFTLVVPVFPFCSILIYLTLALQATLPSTWFQEPLYSFSEFRYIAYSLAYEHRLFTRTRDALVEKVSAKEGRFNPVPGVMVVRKRLQSTPEFAYRWSDSLSAIGCSSFGVLCVCLTPYRVM